MSVAVKEYHELSNIFPLMQGDEFESLKSDIAQNGLREEIWLAPDGLILDGRNRYRACCDLGVEPTFKTYTGDHLVEFVVSLNLHRRHLTASQRAALAVPIKQYLEAAAREKQREAGKDGAEYGKLGGRGNQKPLQEFFPEGVSGKKPAPQSRDIAAAMVKTNARYVDNAEHIANKAPELFEQIKSGEVSLAQAQRMLTKKEREENPPASIAGKYRIWYADPPWEYGNSGIINDSDSYGRAERHYPTMSIRELCDMGKDIRRACEDNAVLFLWVTSPLLEESFPVIKAWGFQYKTSFVWDKIGHNFGHYNSVRHEFLLVCTRGSCTPDNKRLYDSVVSIQKTDRHSEKPEEFRAIIDDLYANGNKIELFARSKVDGWHHWGNEPE